MLYNDHLFISNIYTWLNIKKLRDHIEDLIYIRAAFYNIGEYYYIYSIDTYILYLCNILNNMLNIYLRTNNIN